MESHKTVKVVISGRVQGVYYRAETQRAALETGITGWVRNLASGCVEALFQGSPENIEKMITWCHTGSPHAKVDAVDTENVGDEKIFTGFDIRY